MEELYVLVQVVVLWGHNGMNWGQVRMPHAEQTRVVSVLHSPEECDRAKTAMGPQPSGVALACVKMDNRK